MLARTCWICFLCHGLPTIWVFLLPWLVGFPCEAGLVWSRASVQHFKDSDAIRCYFVTRHNIPLVSPAITGTPFPWHLGISKAISNVPHIYLSLGSQSKQAYRHCPCSGCISVLIVMHRAPWLFISKPMAIPYMELHNQEWYHWSSLAWQPDLHFHIH